MEYIRPHYFKKFSCIASACEDTCCAGWQIVIDEQSMEVYKNMAGGFGNRLHNCIDWKEAVFERDYESGRCAFLNEEDLCDIYAEAGEEYLCKTCREFPRHTEEYEGVKEQSLSLACPVAAELILSQKEKIKFITTYDEEEEPEDEDFDFLFFTKVMDAREYVIEILQNREMPIAKRMKKVLCYGEEVGRKIDADDLFAIDDLTDIYKSRKDTQETDLINENDRREQMERCFKVLADLEVLRPEWEAWTDRCKRTLYTNEKETYKKIYREFNEISIKNETGERFDFELLREQLMVYFTFIYLGTGYYDGEFLAKIRMALWGTELICEMCMAKWIIQNKQLSFKDVADISRCFSREVEHSDVNLERVDELMSKDK